MLDRVAVTLADDLNADHHVKERQHRERRHEGSQHELPRILDLLHDATLGRAVEAKSDMIADAIRQKRTDRVAYRADVSHGPHGDHAFARLMLGRHGISV
jgi:hypothetical protein